MVKHPPPFDPEHRRASDASAVSAAHPPDLIERAREQALENLFDSVLVTDLDGYIVDWNQGSERLFGYSREEILGRPVNTLHMPEDREHVMRDILEAVKREGRWSGEVRLIRKDGRHGWVEASVVPVLDRDGNHVGALGISRDISERKEAEEKLRLAETRFRSLVENAMIGIFILRDEELLYFNPRFAQTFGYPPDFPPEQIRIAGHVLEEDWPMVQENIRRRMAGESLDEPYSFRGRRRDGQILRAEVFGTRIELDGEAAVIGMLQDVTQQREARERLQASEARLRLVIRATNDVIWEWDIPTGDLQWNERAHEAFRYSPEEMGNSIDWWAERIHPEERARVVASLDAQIWGTGEFWSEEYRFLRGDHSYATMLDRGFIQRDERGSPLKAIGAMMDITERRRNEDAQRFLSRASAILDRSIEFDPTLPALVRLIVPEYADLCRVDVLGEHGSVRCAAVADVDAKDEAALAEAQLLDAPLSGSSPLARKIWSGESVLLPSPMAAALERLDESPEYGERWERLKVRSLMVVPMKSHERVLGALMLGITDSGRSYGPVELMLAEDLAWRMAAALENARLYAEAQEAVRAREEILNIVSHDLRNPLGAVQMSAQLLRDTTPERRGDNRKWLTMISRAAQQMEHLVGDLLDAARINTGGFSVNPADHEVAGLLREIKEIFDPLAREKAIALELEVAEGLTSVWLDASQIQRVLSNLVGNAIKFTPEGGTVRVRASREEGEICFSVSDTGPGIPQEELPHVFDRYWQARKGDRRGVGLGLAIAEGIVKAHGGRIWAESGRAQGAAFHFTIPLGTRAPPPG
jgi:PAS domain S-box-containing protein